MVKQKTARKFNVWAKFGVDLDKCNNGANLILDDDGEVYITVARISARNLEYQRKVVELQTKYGFVETEESESEHLRLICEYFIKGWKGITDKQGNDLEFTTENCASLLSEMPDLQDMVVRFGMNRENYSLNLLDETVKN